MKVLMMNSLLGGPTLAMVAEGMAVAAMGAGDMVEEETAVADMGVEDGVVATPLNATMTMK